MQLPDWLYANRDGGGVRMRRWGSWRRTLLSLSIVDEPGQRDPLPACWTVTFWRLYLTGGPTQGVEFSLNPVARWVRYWRRTNGMCLAVAWVPPERREADGGE